MPHDNQQGTSNSADPPAVLEADSRPGRPWKPTVILLSSTLLMLVWKYFGTTDFYSAVLAQRFSIGHPESMAAYYQFSSCLLLLGLIPALIVKVVFRERLSGYGVHLGDRQRTIRSFLITAPLFALGGYLAAMDPSVREAFPVNKQVGLATPLWLHVATYVLYYAGWEFHFRGFLQFGLADSMGRRGAVLIQMMASTLLHLGQPFSETLGAMAAGLIWGWLAYRTNSIASGMMQHIVLGVALDVAITYSH